MPYQSKEQQSVYMRRRYERQRQFFIELLGRQCRRCRATTRLEIDHIDPATKKVRLGKLFGKRTIVTAVIEVVEKCQILCRTCHIDKTRREFAGKVKPINHGTIYAWMKLKCKCETCSLAKWKWLDARNAKQQRGRRNKTIRMIGREVADTEPRPSRSTGV